MKIKILSGGFVLLLIGAAIILGVDLSGLEECSLVYYGPSASFDAEWYAANETLTVTHLGGDMITSGGDLPTIALFVTITDYHSEVEEERVVWLNESVGDPPIEEGDVLKIRQSSTEITLPGNVVNVLWRGKVGYHWPLWCSPQGKATYKIGREKLQSSG